MRICLLMLMGLCAVSVSFASDWHQFRGPNGNGITDETNLPATLDPNETQLWKTPLPGLGEATPAIIAGRVYLSGYDKKAGTLFALCLSADTGKPLWQRSIPTNKPSTQNSAAAPSPTGDTTGVVFLYADGTLVKFDAEGKELWKRDLAADYGPLALGHAYSSSPLLYDHRLYVAVMRDAVPPKNSTYTGPMVSYLLGVNPADGKTLFKVDRPTDAAKDFTNSYNTPLFARLDGKPQIILYGGNYLTGHNPETGAELWRNKYMDTEMPWGRVTSTPVIENNVIYCMFPSGIKAFACDLSKPAAGKAMRIWCYDKQASDVPSPVIVGGYLYMIEEGKKTLICLDAKTGDVQWIGQLDKGDSFYASITAGDGKLYMVNRKGFVTIVAADPKEFRIINTRNIGERPVDSSIAVAGGRLYIRTAENLYCFGTKR
jgi:outer membrane protein assembly factor BamB